TIPLHRPTPLWRDRNTSKQKASPGFLWAGRGAKLDRHSRRYPLASLQMKRRFGPWLLGLFLLAHIAGVLPVMFDHAVHVFESRPPAVDVHHRGASHRHGDHHHGVADVQDECCVLHHHLAGVVPLTTPEAAFTLIEAPLTSPPPRTLPSAAPTPPARRPKRD